MGTTRKISQPHTGKSIKTSIRNEKTLLKTEKRMKKPNPSTQKGRE